MGGFGTGFGRGPHEVGGADSRIVVAVITTKFPREQLTPLFKSNRRGYKEADNSWTAFVGTDTDRVVREALETQTRFENNGYGPYEVLYGRLHAEVVIPPRDYLFRPLEVLDR